MESSETDMRAAGEFGQFFWWYGGVVEEAGENKEKRNGGLKRWIKKRLKRKERKPLEAQD
jgi:hypothetical protein